MPIDSREGGARTQLLLRWVRRIRAPIDSRGADSAFLFDSDLSQIHALKTTDLRFQSLCKFSPSVSGIAADTFLIRGRQGLRMFVPWLHLMGELSKPQVLTEGEKPLGRCTHAVFAS